MTKENKNGSVIFHPNVKTYLMPQILEEIIGDDGELHYILDNGRTSLATLYNALWLPKRTQINWKAKGENPDRTRVAR